ncbi:MAG: TIGR02646 family protein [Myxococcota bacterium]
MRRIAKSKPGPPRLLELRQQGKRYTDLDANPKDKQRVRTALLDDQGYLCCYCMRRISPEKHRIKIEHHESQSSNPDRELDWNNLLVACSGGPKLRARRKDDKAARKIPTDLQTCDTRKGNADITINPLDSSVDDIEYLPNGQLGHPQPSLQEDIDQHLNLNVGFLVEARKSARRAMIEALDRTLGSRKEWTRDKLTRYLEGLRSASRLEPFFGLLEHDLNRWIARRR